MKTIYYARRKNGIHGFLKIVDGVDGDLCKGEEIHFRVERKLFEAVRKAFGAETSTDGMPMRLIVKTKERERDDLILVPVVSGSDGVIGHVWGILKQDAVDISREGNAQSRYEINCHTLVFKVLKRTGLDAPWSAYRAVLSSMIVCDEREALQGRSTHHPSSTPR